MGRTLGRGDRYAAASEGGGRRGGDGRDVRRGREDDLAIASAQRARPRAVRPRRDVRASRRMNRSGGGDARCTPGSATRRTRWWTRRRTRRCRTRRRWRRARGRRRTPRPRASPATPTPTPPAPGARTRRAARTGSRRTRRRRSRPSPGRSGPRTGSARPCPRKDFSEPDIVAFSKRPADDGRPSERTRAREREAGGDRSVATRRSKTRGRRVRSCARV